eukprot:4408799-Pyramimonas_sp.AAC.1
MPPARPLEESWSKTHVAFFPCPGPRAAAAVGAPAAAALRPRVAAPPLARETVVPREDGPEMEAAVAARVPDR